VVNEASQDVVDFNLYLAKNHIVGNRILKRINRERLESLEYRKRAEQKARLMQGYHSAHLKTPDISTEVKDLFRTIEWVYEQLGNYLDVAPSILKKQILLCEIADRELERMRSDRHSDQILFVAERVKSTLGYISP